MLAAQFDVTLGTFHLDVEFGCRNGETLVLLGESGCGKSTVLRLLAGLLRPDSGSFVLDDVIYDDTQTKFHVPVEDRPVGFVFQEYILFPHLSVFDNVGFGLKMQGIPGNVIRQRVGEALEQVHLVGYDDRRPKQLSGGQQQRVAIARALALSPQLLLLDESLSALDIQTRREVEQELRQILDRLSVTTVMVSHQYSDALLFADQIMVMAQGRVIQKGTHLDLLRNPKSSYIAEMVGVNRFEGKVAAFDPASRDCRVLLAGEHGTAVELAAVGANGGSDTPVLESRQDVSVVIHPRNVMLHPGPPEEPAANVLRGELVQVTPVSASISPATRTMEGLMRVAMTIDPALPMLTSELEVAASSGLELVEGKSVYASFRASDAVAFP